MVRHKKLLRAPKHIISLNPIFCGTPCIVEPELQYSAVVRGTGWKCEGMVQVQDSMLYSYTLPHYGLHYDTLLCTLWTATLIPF